MKIFNFQFSSFQNQAGQALIEVLVAVSVLTVGLLGIVTLLSRALSLNRVVADNYAATYLAAEGIETVKNMIDGCAVQKAGWNCNVLPGDYEVQYNSTNLAQFAGRKLLFDPQNDIYSYAAGNPTAFVRKVSIKYVGDGSEEVQVNSEVSWTTRGGGSFRVNLEDHFFNWR